MSTVQIPSNDHQSASKKRLRNSVFLAAIGSRKSKRAALMWFGFWLAASMLCPAQIGCRQSNDVKSASQNVSAIEPEGSPQSLAIERGPIHFTDMLADSGIDFVHVSGDSPEKPFPAANGSGVAAFDYDLDGHCDLLFLTGTNFPLDPSRTAPVNRCYRNRGDWKFEDVTTATQLGHSGYSAGAAVGDVDADGFADVYVTCFGRNQLFLNQGDGTFAEVGRAAEVDDDLWSTSAAFLDYDQDGLLDLYVCNYAVWSWDKNTYCGDAGRGVRIFCHPSTVEPQRHRLYHNDGDGRFHDALAEAGLDVPRGRGQGVVASDVNGDGLIDLYVANDLHPNFLFFNRGDGTFHDATDSSGTAFDHLGRSQAGMGVAAADMNGDGRIDLFVTNYEGEHNAFYENLGDALFQDVSHSSGLAAESLRHVGWGTALADFDLDGWLDVIVTNGHTDNNLAKLGRDSEYLQPPGLWRNQTGRFVFCGGSAAGKYFAGKHPGRGLSVVDLDCDGDLDVVMAHKDAVPGLLRNDCLNERTSLRCVRLQLIGTQSNRDAVGASIEVSRAGNKHLTIAINGGGSYLSASERRLFVAGDQAASVMTIRIRWPSGIRQHLSVTSAHESMTVIEPTTSDAH